MALSDLERSVLYNTHNYLWQQDMLINAYFHGSTVGANLREMMIGRPPVVPLTNPFDEAITGKMRSDSRAIRQNASNVQEGAQMMGIASEAVKTIKSTLEEMEALAKALKEQKDNDETGSWEASDADKADYKAMKDKIESIINYTSYNNIPLLDGSQWPTGDQIDEDGNVFIKGLPGSDGGKKDGGFNINFRNLDDLNWERLSSEHLKEDDSPENEWENIEGQLGVLSNALGDINLIDDIYTRRKSGLEFQAASLESQADILDQAVEARRQTPTLSLEEIILRLLHQYTGSIIDETS